MPDLATLVIRVDAQGVVTARRELDTMTESAGKTTSSVDKMTAGVKGMIAAAAGVAAAVYGVVKLTQSFIEAEQTAARVSNAFRLTGQNADTGTRSVLALASSLQAVTRFGDDATSAAGALLVQLAGVTERGLQRALPLVQDLAETLGLDLNSAVQLVAKALSDNEGALGRYGIKVAEASTRQEQFNNVMSALESKAGGTARAVGDTLAGKVAQFTNAIDDMKEAGGQALAVFLTPAITALTDIVSRMTEAAYRWQAFNALMETGKVGTTLEELERQRAGLQQYLRMNEPDLGKIFREEGVGGFLKMALVEQVGYLLSGQNLYDLATGKNPAAVKEALNRVDQQIAREIYAMRWVATGQASGENNFLKDILDPDAATGSGAWAPGKWQEWFKKATGVPVELFRDSGETAAKLFLDGLASQIDAAGYVASILGEKLDPVDALEAQRGKVAQVIEDLLSVPAGQIDEPFSIISKSIVVLVSRLAELDDQIKRLRGSAASLPYLPGGGLQFDPGDTSAPFGLVDRSFRDVGDLGNPLGLARSLAKFRPVLDDGADGADAFNDAMERLSGSMGRLALEGVLDGLHEIGRALYEGKLTADTFGEAIGSMAAKILEAAPSLFLQAGLQMIATPGMWPVGLALLAAAGMTAIAGGIVEGHLASESAHGNVFDGGRLVPFASGGIVTRPTVFPMARGGVGLMGEAGPEAILPLVRGPGGNLGVRSEGGGLSVNIHNYAGVPVQTRERMGPSGRELEVFVGGIVQKKLTDGSMDKSMAANYGVRRKGQRL